MSSTYTTNLNLRKPSHRDPETLESWDYVLNNNFDLIDAAFGLKSYTEQNYIANSDTHSLSLDKLDMALFDTASLSPSVNQKAALAGPGDPDYTPSGLNPFVTVNYVLRARKTVLSPEYPGAVLYDGGATPTAGTMITDYQVVAPWGYNFYKWVSTAGVFETYWVVTRWRAPETFTAFNLAANKALIIDIATEDTGLDAQIWSTIYRDGVSGTVSSLGPKSSTVAGVWRAEKKGDELLYYNFTDPVLASIAAGDTLVIMLGMKSKNTKYAKIGDITIQYTG